MDRSKDSRRFTYSLNTINRFGNIFLMRLKLKDKILRAIKIQDKLREKSKGWNAVLEIRKWRDQRYRL